MKVKKKRRETKKTDLNLQKLKLKDEKQAFKIRTRKINLKAENLELKLKI